MKNTLTPIVVVMLLAVGLLMGAVIQAELTSWGVSKETPSELTKDVIEETVVTTPTQETLYRMYESCMSELSMYDSLYTELRRTCVPKSLCKDVTRDGINK